MEIRLTAPRTVNATEFLGLGGKKKKENWNYSLFLRGFRGKLASKGFLVFVFKWKRIVYRELLKMLQRLCGSKAV